MDTERIGTCGHCGHYGALVGWQCVMCADTSTRHFWIVLLGWGSACCLGAIVMVLNLHRIAAVVTWLRWHVVGW